MTIGPSPFASLLAPAVPDGARPLPLSPGELPSDAVGEQQLFSELFASLMIPSGLTIATAAVPTTPPLATEMEIGSDSESTLIPEGASGEFTSGTTAGSITLNPAMVPELIQARPVEVNAPAVSALSSMIVSPELAEPESGMVNIHANIPAPVPAAPDGMPESQSDVPSNAGVASLPADVLLGQGEVSTRTWQRASASSTIESPTVKPSAVPLTQETGMLALPHELARAVRLESVQTSEHAAASLTQNSAGELLPRTTGTAQPIKTLRTITADSTKVTTLDTNELTGEQESAFQPDVLGESALEETTRSATDASLQQEREFLLTGQSTTELLADLPAQTDPKAIQFMEWQSLETGRPLTQTAAPDATKIATTSTVLVLPDKLDELLMPVGRTVTLRLEPDTLGPARLQLTLQGDQLTARITVERPEAKALLDSSLGQLTQQLERAGIRVEQIQIQLAGQAAHDQLPQRGPDWHRPDRHKKQEQFSINDLLSRPRAQQQYVGAVMPTPILSATQVNMVA